MSSSIPVISLIASSMNRTASLANDLLGDEIVKAATIAMTPSKPNLVLDNMAVLIAQGVNVDGQDMVRVTMLDCPCSSPTRCISKTEFDSLNILIPMPQNFKKGNVYLVFRHGQAYHNLINEQRIKLMTESPALLSQYLELAKLRFQDEIKWETLTFEQQIQKAADEMCYDSPLTEVGIQDTIACSERIKAFIDANFLLYRLQISASSLYRAYQSAAIVGKQLGYKNPIRASYRELDEINREMRSSNHPLGSHKRKIAESMTCSLDDYVFTILLTPPPMSREEWEQQSAEFKEPYYHKVKMILAENTPRPLVNRPTELEGLQITHKGSGRTFEEVHLVSVLPLITNLTYFASGNKRKIMDFESVLGNIHFVDHDLPEIQDIPVKVAIEKAMKMCQFGVPIVVDDTSLGRGNEVQAAMIKHLLKAKTGTLVQALNGIYPGVETFEYSSIIAFCDGSRKVLFKCTTKCRLKDISIEVLKEKKIVGDIDPFVVPVSYTLEMILDDAPPVLIREYIHDNPEGLTIGELQALNPANRCKYNPRYPALEGWKLWMEENDIPF
jgi:broad specificity phosphatase PhoE